MKITATVVLPVQVIIDVPGPLEGQEKVDNNLPEVWSNWRMKVLRKLFTEAEHILKTTLPKAKISTCSLTELEGEMNIYPEENFVDSLEDELPPTVKAFR